MSKTKQTIYGKYSPIELKALALFLGSENEYHVESWCPSASAPYQKRQEFLNLMQAFVELDPEELDGNFDEINRELQDGTLVEKMAEHSQNIVRDFMSRYKI